MNVEITESCVWILIADKHLRTLHTKYLQCGFENRRMMVKQCWAETGDVRKRSASFRICSHFRHLLNWLTGQDGFKLQTNIWQTLHTNYLQSGFENHRNG